MLWYPSELGLVPPSPSHRCVQTSSLPADSMLHVACRLLAWMRSWPLSARGTEKKKLLWLFLHKHTGSSKRGQHPCLFQRGCVCLVQVKASKA